MKAHIPVFSPIVHSHPVAIHCDIDPFDLSIWLPSEQPILACASGIIMVKAEGWEDSVGMNAEREVFETAGKPVIYMEPRIIPTELKSVIAQLNPV